MLFAIEGVDGSGKGTQTALLSQRLNRENFQTTTLSFPRYQDGRCGEMVGRYLNGNIGLGMLDSPHMVAMLFAADRFEARSMLSQAASDENRILLCDRYVESNIAHQAAKFEAEGQKDVIDWIEYVEYQLYLLPKPNLTVWLNMPVEHAVPLIAAKAQRTYTDKAADVHEADVPYLGRVCEVYATRFNPRTWAKIDCVRDGRLLAPEEVSDLIWNEFMRYLGRPAVHSA